MEAVRVLVVEDDSVVADAVAEGLRDQGMAVDVAYDGPGGSMKVAVNTYDVVVLHRDFGEPSVIETVVGGGHRIP